MKRELDRIVNLFRTEIHLATSIASIMLSRRNVLIVGSFALLLLAGSTNRLAEARLSFSPLPFLRGGHVAFAPPRAEPMKTKRTHPSIPRLVGGLHRTINSLGNKIQTETAGRWSDINQNVGRGWNDLNQNVGREWGRLTSSVGRIFSGQQSYQGTRKLDEVLRAFKSVLNGSNEVDTAKLLQACRAHLALMKTGGSAMKVVAKDMEGNLNKAEALFKTLPKEGGRHLASLLEAERHSGIHEGNMLKDASAAMGLLWIRRSLAFQLDLYSSLIPSNGRHPKDAAMDAYYKILSPYHGWLLQKAFPLSLSQMPDRQTFIAKFGGTEVEELDAEYEREIVKKLKSLVATWEPIIDTWRGEFERLDLEDTRRA